MKIRVLVTAVVALAGLLASTTPVAAAESVVDVQLNGAAIGSGDLTGPLMLSGVATADRAGLAIQDRGTGNWLRLDGEPCVDCAVDGSFGARWVFNEVGVGSARNFGILFDLPPGSYFIGVRGINSDGLRLDGVWDSFVVKVEEQPSGPVYLNGFDARPVDGTQTYSTPQGNQIIGARIALDGLSDARQRGGELRLAIQRESDGAWMQDTASSLGVSEDGVYAPPFGRRWRQHSEFWANDAATSLTYTQFGKAVFAPGAYWYGVKSYDDDGTIGETRWRRFVVDPPTAPTLAQCTVTGTGPNEIQIRWETDGPVAADASGPVFRITTESFLQEVPGEIRTTDVTDPNQRELFDTFGNGTRISTITVELMGGNTIDCGRINVSNPLSPSCTYLEDGRFEIGPIFDALSVDVRVDRGNGRETEQSLTAMGSFTITGTPDTSANVWVTSNLPEGTSRRTDCGTLDFSADGIDFIPGIVDPN